MQRTYVASIGDAESPLTWSGIPYHLTDAGRKVGFITSGLPLEAAGLPWKARRAAWNLAQVMSGDRRGGYQYSRGFLERLWRPFRAQVSGAAVINCFQLYAPSIVEDDAVQKWFFIDLTLAQLLDYYRTRSSVGRRVVTDALVREREGYHRARGVITMSRFAADNVHQAYGVPAERIHVVVPGANLDQAAYEQWEQGEKERRDAGPVRSGGKLRLVMVSTNWQRKGLDRLLRAIAIGRRDGLQVSLRVIGNQRQELPVALTALDDIEWMGRISKSTDAVRFLRAVADADLGCIFSRYEAGGSVLREYHALGLGALATDAGGMPDFMFDDASVTVKPDASDEELAATLVALARDEEQLAALRAAAWRRRREALWETSVVRLRAVMSAAAST
ncbi:MAG TPA: glycosyltransferase family 4 protein [Polyangia bacterium]|jgi:glycosyltransferase involved in cell wall biosynthesis